MLNDTQLRRSLYRHWPARILLYKLILKLQHKPRGGHLRGYCVIFAFAVQFYGTASSAESFYQQLEAAALERTTHIVRYDGAYRQIPFPMGDVPPTTGVCTDTVIRSYRALGIDLQALVNKDMRENFDAYPSRSIWGMRAPDTNIDHRRVPNLMTFFSRHGQVLGISHNKEDYLPGDIVTWMLPGNLPHIGIIVSGSLAGKYHPYVVHNIGAGPQREDVLFKYTINGHYRYQSERLEEYK